MPCAIFKKYQSHNIKPKSVIYFIVILQVFVVAVAAAAPQYLEDTEEVKAAKAEFQAAFDLAEAGGLVDLAPVNNDVQAEQISEAFLEDDEDVAAAKAAFLAAFDDAAAGGLAAKQAPAPTHVIPAAPAVVPAVAPLAYHAPALGYNYLAGAHPYFYGGYHHTALPYNLPAFGLAGLPYNGLPVIV